MVLCKGVLVDVITETLVVGGMLVDVIVETIVGGGRGVCRTDVEYDAPLELVEFIFNSTLVILTDEGMPHLMVDLLFTTVSVN